MNGPGSVNVTARCELARKLLMPGRGRWRVISAEMLPVQCSWCLWWYFRFCGAGAAMLTPCCGSLMQTLRLLTRQRTWSIVRRRGAVLVDEQGVNYLRTAHWSGSTFTSSGCRGVGGRISKSFPERVCAIR